MEVQDVLGEAYREGRLTEVELSERLDRLHASKTCGDLVPLVEDLPCLLSFLGEESVTIIPTSDQLVHHQGSHRAGWVLFAVFMALLVLGSPMGAPILILLPLSYLVFRGFRRSRYNQCC